MVSLCQLVICLEGGLKGFIWAREPARCERVVWRHLSQFEKCNGSGVKVVASRQLTRKHVTWLSAFMSLCDIVNDYTLYPRVGAGQSRSALAAAQWSSCATTCVAIVLAPPQLPRGCSNEVY